MDRISHLPDDLLLRILSLVQTKTAVDAQLLSKRWRNLWKKLPSLYYDYTSHKSDSHLFVFIRRTLELLESQVLESLHLRIVPTGTSSEVVLKGELLAKRPLRELDFVTSNPNELQIKKGIYQLQTLVILRLEGFSLEDDYGDLIPLPSLKVLQLRRVRYSSDRSLSNLLSSLPSLEDLLLDRCFSVQHAQTLSIKVPCLQRLTVVQCPDSCRSHLMVLNVVAPSLKYLNVEDYWRGVSFSDEKNMEDLIEVDVNVTYIDTEKLLRAVISAKRLSLCLLTSKIPRVYLFFNQLVRLEICTCQKEWWNLLEGVLLYSPKLRVLKLHQKHSFGITDPTVIWKEPSCVPGCFASHLETFEWRGYEGTEEEKKIASYILRNAGRLKNATIYPLISHPDIRMHGFLRNFMHNELANFARCFFTCELVFK